MGYEIFDQTKGEGLHFMRDASRPYVLLYRYYKGYKGGSGSYVIGHYATRKGAKQAQRRHEAK